MNADTPLYRATQTGRNQRVLPTIKTCAVFRIALFLI